MYTKLAKTPDEVEDAAKEMLGQRLVTKQDEDAANLYLTKFAQLLRNILEQSREASIRLEDELSTLRLYLEMEGLRIQDRHELVVEVAPDVPVDSIWLPSMLVQPYVENAIRHGLLHKQTPGELRVSFSLENDFLTCIVEDNGIGRAKAAELNAGRGSTHRSLGTTVTHDRIATLRESGMVGLDVTIEDLHANGQPSGTRVRLTIPIDSDF